MAHINISKNNLVFGGCDTVELAEKYGTPLYVISEGIIKEKCKIIKEDFLFKHRNTKAAYASKAFLNLTMCKIIDREGLYLDIVSGGELYTAIKADFPMEKIIFHGNNKTNEELYLAIRNNVGRIVVDNMYEFDLIENIAKQFNKNVKILYRLTPGVNSDTHNYITTGQKDSKFGISLERSFIHQAVKRAMDSKFIELMGFHFHVGSQLMDNSSHIAGLKIILKLVREMKNEFGFITKELNTGGGFGIAYSEEDKPRPLRHFTDTIMEEIEAEFIDMGIDRPTVIIEPGRWLIAEAGITLYTIGSIKEIPNIRTYVAVDGGMTDNLRPALYGAKYEGVIANRINEPKDNIVTVAGKCCESGDVLIKDLEVPKIQPGDILAVFNTGAYNYSMANNYNRNVRPGVVLINNGKSELIVRRETYEDLLNRENIPERLMDNKVCFKRQIL